MGEIFMSQLVANPEGDDGVVVVMEIMLFLCINCFWPKITWISKFGFAPDNTQIVVYKWKKNKGGEQPSM